MSQDHKMRIVVTGGSGFIGTYLVERLLERGHDVIIFDWQPSRRFEWLRFPGDLRRPEEVAAAVESADAVYHLAAQHRDDVRPKSLYYDVNVRGTENLIRGARDHDIQRIIFTSSSAVYGLSDREANEDSPTQPFNDYGHSKLEAERLLRQWAAAEGGRLLIVRPTAVFGAGTGGNVLNLVESIARRRFVMVGRGRNWKSLCYVKNLVAFLVDALTADYPFTTVNYADKPDFSMDELVRFVREELGLNGYLPRIPYWLGMAGGLAFDCLATATGRRMPVSGIRVRKFCSETRLATARLEQTGFRRPYTLEEGLRELVQAVRFTLSSSTSDPDTPSVHVLEGSGDGVRPYRTMGDVRR
jgi:nucleoside-diphosphate-sugar epimerase